MSDQVKSDLVTLSIDGRSVSVAPNTLVVDAAAALNIEIPVFCSHPKLDPVACCRMCLVEIEGPRGPMLQTACSVPVREGMVVRTDTQQVQDTQEANLAFILLNHPLDCPICDKGGECPLQDQTMRYGPGISQLVEPKRRKKKHYLISDTIVLDQERCVVCWRCIRYLEEWEDKPQLGLFERGGETIIDVQEGKPVDAKTGGNIIDICPVGALTNRVARFAYRPWEIERTASISIQDSMGSNIRMDSRTHKVRRIVGRENMQVNDQWIDDKTRFNHGWINHEDRLTTPLIRKNGQLGPATWAEALQFVADKLNAIKKSNGANAIGGIGSAKLSNEANYLLQRFMRQIVGTNNIDFRDGSDVAAIPGGIPNVTALMKPQYGPNPSIDTVLLFGVDPSEELPVLDLHLKRAIRRGGMKVIVAHPRKIELTRYEHPYLGYRPGSEAALINALTQQAIAARPEDKPKVDASALGNLNALSEQQIGDVTGVDGAAIKAAAEALAQSKNALIIYGPLVARGATGAAVRDGLSNLAQVTGHYDRLAYIGLDGNSHGARDMGVLPNQLPGYAGLDDKNAQATLQRVWGKTNFSTTPGKSYRAMLDAAGSEIKALYIMGANPGTEDLAWDKNLDKLDLLVVQELFLTETAAKADVVLPAVSWAETDGTFTNLERRVQRANKAIRDPQSKAAADWMILDHLATRMGNNWPYADERAITREISEAIPLYKGLSWDALGDQGQQYDASRVRPAATLRQIEQGEDSSLGNGEFVLIGGSVTYDDGNMFKATPHMRNYAFGRHAGICGADAARLGIEDGAPLVVENERGTLTLNAKIHEQVLPGTVWIPESIEGAPVGTLLGGNASAKVNVKVAERAMAVAA
jgi:NADH-quinone oxidoreductase chain G